MAAAQNRVCNQEQKKGRGEKVGECGKTLKANARYNGCKRVLKKHTLAPREKIGKEEEAAGIRMQKWYNCIRDREQLGQ